MNEALQKIFNLLTTTLAIGFLIVGCSPKTSIKYTESEVQLIPPVAFPRAFNPGSNVIIKTKDLKLQMKVKDYEGDTYIIGLDEDSKKELKIAINEIIEIEKIIFKEKKQ